MFTADNHSPALPTRQQQQDIRRHSQIIHGALYFHHLGNTNGSSPPPPLAEPLSDMRSTALESHVRRSATSGAPQRPANGATKARVAARPDRHNTLAMADDMATMPKLCLRTGFWVPLRCFCGSLFLPRAGTVRSRGIKFGVSTPKISCP